MTPHAPVCFQRENSVKDTSGTEMLKVAGFFFIYESAADREAKCDAEEIIQPQQIFICLLHSP